MDEDYVDIITNKNNAENFFIYNNNTPKKKPQQENYVEYKHFETEEVWLNWMAQILLISHRSSLIECRVKFHISKYPDFVLRRNKKITELMNHWFHCNHCFMIGAGGNGSYWFTSCGHLICFNCLKSSGSIPGQKGPCIVCRKQDSIATEINRSMRPDILAIFRPPKDLLVDFVNKLKTVMDYQANQSQHLIKHLHDKSNKAVKFAKAAQSEIAKRSEREQSIMAENGQMKAELEKARQYNQHLKNVLAERHQEIKRLKHKYYKSPRATICRTTPSPHKNKVASIFPSLNGPTPLSKLSFFACTTSTPFEPKRREAAVTPPFSMREMFDTPQAREDSTVAAGGLDYSNQQATNTPALLGFASGRHSPKNYF